VDITFQTTKLQKVCNSESKLIRKYGNKEARLIMRRMDFLSQTPKLGDVPHLPPTKLHELRGNRCGQFAVYLQHPYRLVFIPNHNPIPLKDDGGIDLNRVTAITITEVQEDYHKNG
jgi:proteic killer suppression protein